MTSWDPPTGPIMVPRPSRLPWVIALVAVAALLVVGGLWARSVASDRSAEADGLNHAAARLDDQAKQITGDAGNDALSDQERTRAVIDYLTPVIATTFSYDYRDLGKTETAVEKYLTADARCEWNLLFGEVKKYAPEQKIILETTVRELAISHLDKDTAEALVYIDQQSTRVDVNKTVSVGGQFAIVAHRDGDDWKISELDLFSQPLFNGKPAPSC
jgi:Mce-associated membrane protein